MQGTGMSITSGWTVNQVTQAYPPTLRVFGRYGIDSCCGGTKTLAEVATAHNLSLEQLLKDLHAAITPQAVVLDVRSDIRAGRDPLEKILAAADGIGDDQELIILNDFEPVPLYRVLGGRGFSHQTERTSDSAWRIVFQRKP